MVISNKYKLFALPRLKKLLKNPNGAAKLLKIIKSGKNNVE